MHNILVYLKQPTFYDKNLVFIKTTSGPWAAASAKEGDTENRKTLSGKAWQPGHKGQRPPACPLLVRMLHKRTRR
jgi:hypothetical protein